MVKHLKWVTSMLLTFCMLVPCFVQAAETEETNAKAPYKQFYVSTQGDDTAEGTKESPFKTIQRAQEEVRKYNREMTGDIVVNVASGNYFLDDRLIFHAVDSGFNGYRVIYRGEEGEKKPLISAGRPITGFKPWEGNPNIYVADVENYNHMINYITVNDALRRDASGVPFQHKGHWDDPNTVNKPDGMYVSKEDFAMYENMEDMYIEWWDGWIANYVYLSDVYEDPNNTDQLIVRGYDGMFEFYALSEHEHTGLTTRRRSRPRNAFELLDEPGEFYYNRKQGKIYYMPKEGEDMSTAEVIRPHHEDIIYMVGNDREEPVKNITIDNFRIANSKYYAFEETGGARFGQLSEWKTGGTDMPAGGIDIFLADNIEIINNEIYNTGQAGISLLREVDNCRIEGNIIRDCGDAGVYMGGITEYYYGSRFTRHPVTALDKNALCHPGVFRRVQMSYGDRDISGHLGYYRTSYVHQTWFDDTFYDQSIVNSEGAWPGNPETERLGVKNWMRIDMREAFSWDKIIIQFKESVPEERRNNFEVLLSNDRFFGEGNYVVAKTFMEPADFITEIDAKELGKYRYILVRTLGATKISLTGVYPFTSDVRPYEHTQWPENNVLTNNVVARCGNFNYGSGNVANNVTKNTEISYNQIQETSYSGIMMGWAWNHNSLQIVNTDIHHNYVKDFGLNCFDGGGVYTTGDNGGTTIHHNYFDSKGICYGTLYTDGGTANITFENNVVANGNQNTFMLNMLALNDPANGNCKNMTLRNNYGSNTNIWGTGPTNGQGGINCSVEMVKQIVPGQETGEAKEIINGAGLQEGYKHLAENLTDGDLGLYNMSTALLVAREWTNLQSKDYIRDNMRTQYMNAAEYMLKNGSFGGGENDFPPEYRIELEDALADLEECDEDNQGVALVKMSDVINRARSVVGTANIDAKDSGMVAISVAGAENIEHDFDKRIATVYFGVGSDVTGKSLNVSLNDECDLAYSTYNLRMNKDLVIPIYHTDTRKYEYWTLKIRESKDYVKSVDSENWNYGGGRSAKVGNELYVRSEASSIMHKYCLDPENSTVFSFRPVIHKENAKIGFIIGTLNNTPFDVKTTLSTYDRTELVFTKEGCSLYNVEKGQYTLIGKISSDLIKWGEKNTLEIAKTGKNLDKLNIKINGSDIFHETKVKSKGNYFGFYSDDLAMYF